jgi:uncharacterized protein YebE (UPF0316 family)
VPDIALYAGAVALVFFLRVIGVAVGTIRILLTNRGMQIWSAILGFIEVLVYVVGIGVVVKDLTDIPILMSYCVGFSIGNVVGIRIEQRMAIGYVSLRVISKAQGLPIATALREKGFGATLSSGEGRDGTVGIVTAVISRKQSREAIRLVQSLDPDAFMVVDEARAVSRGWLPTNIGGVPVTTAPPTPSFDLDVVPPPNGSGGESGPGRPPSPQKSG